MYKILLLEDDEMLSQTISSLLKKRGFDITVCKNIDEALDATYEQRYDLYLLDINVPMGNGIDLLKDLRDAGDKTPAFFITAMKDIEHISKGFDAGCDDYIKKPFDFDELIVRIEATIKKNNPMIRYGKIEYDPVEGRVYKDGDELELGEVSLQVLVLLLKNSGTIVRKDQFFEVMQKDSDTALRVQINKLKSDFDLQIKNIRGVGYKLERL